MPISRLQSLEPISLEKRHIRIFGATFSVVKLKFELPCRAVESHPAVAASTHGDSVFPSFLPLSLAAIFQNHQLSGLACRRTTTARSTTRLPSSPARSIRNQEKEDFHFSMLHVELWGKNASFFLLTRLKTGAKLGR